ncbi:hypothetical protein EDB87DRAFT_1686547 [Lactarius vividus]|nr:hypothetical protein EDB87DRAFT_1686547 [Lactarius vividus]
MYLEMATEEDKKMAEGWAADADGILIFTGLFSAVVASLISVSIQDIRPNPQDTSNFYLANIYRTLADPVSNVSSSLPTSPPPFTPPNYAVWWARRYLKVTQPRYSPHKRARIRAFFAEGVDKFLLPWAVEALPTLLHVSLFLFFAGISVFLWNVDLTIFKSVVSWIAICTTLYGCITFIPIFRHDSSYRTPLSLLAWNIAAGTLFVTFRVIRWITTFVYRYILRFYLRHLVLGRIVGAYIRLESLEKMCRSLLMQGMQRMAEETALNSRSEIDTRAFLWTLSTLDEDHELERFFSGLPGFRNSNVVVDPLPGLTEEQKEMISTALMELLNVTFSSDLLPEYVRDRRAIICAKALDAAHIPVFRILNKILSRYQYNSSISADIVQIMNGWGKHESSSTNLAAAFCMTIAKNPSSETTPHTVTICHFAILIHVARQQFNHFEEGSWPEYQFSEILEAGFGIRRGRYVTRTAARFLCSLESNRSCSAECQQPDDGTPNPQVRFARFTYLCIKIPIPRQHDPLTPRTYWTFCGTLSSYPLCNVASHIHHNSSPVTIARTALDDNAVPIPASLANPDVPSLSVPASLRVVDCLADMPRLDNPAHQTATESLRTLATSPDPATTDAFVAPGMTMPPPTSATSTCAFPLHLTSPPHPLPVSHQHNADLLAPSYPSDLPFSALSNPFLDNTLPTGAPLSSHLPMTQSGLSPTFPPSPRLLIAATAPINPPPPTSAANLGATTKDD